MKIGLAKEKIDGEKRVALTPDSIKNLLKNKFSVLVESGAGSRASYSDLDYKNAGATIVNDYSSLISQANIILKVRHPIIVDGVHEAENIKKNGFLLGIQDPINQSSNIDQFQKNHLNVFAMEFIPRTTLAQSMDVNSSMATVAGYKAVLLAAQNLDKFYPMFMTAAGTIPPAKVLVLGAGVAGLQAIATAKRLGAVVEAFDLRPAVKEQVESLGAKFIHMDTSENLEDAQGYAKEATSDFIKKEMDLINKHLSKSDVCITTAQVFGKKAPILIKDYMIKNMKPGSVIVDLSIEQGGNCELSQKGKSIEIDGVKILAHTNLLSEMAHHSSRMYSKNIENFLIYLKQNCSDENGELLLDSKDEILSRTLIVKNGVLVSDIIKKVLNK